MHVNLAFFEEDALLCRGSIACGAREDTTSLAGCGLEFLITHRQELAAARISIVCSRDGEHLYKTALNMPVHDSTDWESINLGNIHTLAFYCRRLPGGAA